MKILDDDDNKNEGVTMVVARVIVVSMPSFYGVGAASVARQRRMVTVRRPCHWSTATISVFLTLTFSIWDVLHFVLFLFVSFCFNGEENLRKMFRVDDSLSFISVLFWLLFWLLF